MDRKEAIEIARKLYNDSLFLKKDKEAMVTLIPELMEDEDENELLHKVICSFINNPDIPYEERDKVSKKIIPYVESLSGNCKPSISADALREGITKFGLTQHQIDNWLKKYADVSDLPVCQMKPKFKVGDMIKLKSEPKYPYREIVNIRDGAYYFDSAVYLPFESQDEYERKAKFKVGDWCIDKNDGRVFLITDVSDSIYTYISTEGNENRGSCDVIDSVFRRWTIEDARDGDVLAEHETIVLFKCIEGINIRTHFTYHYLNTLWTDTNQLHNKRAYSPATKKERDLMEAVIKNAGYVWNNEKKELKKQDAKKPEDSGDTSSPFKKGNWYQCIKGFRGKSVRFDNGTAYYCAKDGCLQDELGGGGHVDIVKELYGNFRPWTIEDAKPGDILIDPATRYDEKSVFIFERIDETGVVRCYATFSNMEKLYISDGTSNVCGYMHRIEYRPADQEECRILTEKLKEAGYLWDAESKSLKKIEEQEKTDAREVSEEFMGFVRSFVEHRTKDRTLIPSDDDIRRWASAILKNAEKEFVSPAWTDKDTEMVRLIGNAITTGEASGYLEGKNIEIIDAHYWLEDFKYRVSPFNGWKPTEEQMNELDAARHNLTASPDVLTSLYNDLNELMK